MIVFGPSLMKLGNQPRNRKSIPSFWTAFIMPVTALSWCLWAFMILVLMTSAGEHIVVATKLAIKLAPKCVFLCDGSMFILVTM